MTASARKPAVRYLQVPENSGQLERVLDTVRRGWAAIAAGDFRPDPSATKCVACPYRSRCPVFAGS